MSEINVTPFVDVMLVLLVVFMITAPLLTVGVPVDLPKTRAEAIPGEAIPGQDEPLSVSLDAQNRIWVQEREVELTSLGPLLKEVSGNKPDVRIFVRGDKGISYGRVLEVMSEISTAGFTRVALVAQPVEPPAKGGAAANPKGAAATPKAAR